ncbi:alpha/beta hydrolase [Pelagivirga sediminicola]|uniref:Alpha/beta hydrolase n=1 Tax=Pelagivirga sediminicola TaxID=2170575 RepID=A0A2T7G646_9RHOB|nr:alpha/beta hydrolase [Pelagivirga sediminicola]PVA09901.1 alpha/beta hydrolase [Pelagivirga sediminicola]
MPCSDKGGFPTYWTTYGQGPRPAVLIHCSLADVNIWRGMAQLLSGALTMTAFDLPGHGRSADWDGRAEMSAACAAIAADFVQNGAPIDLIGHSFGGVVALRLAVERPNLVRSLVMIEPVFFAAGLRDRPEACAAHLVEYGAFEAAMEAGDPMEAARGFIGAWGGGRPWDSFSAEAQARIARQMPLIAAASPALYDDAGGLLEPGVLEAVDIPALLLEGSEAPQIIPAITEALAARLPRAQRGVIGGAGHMSVATHPDQVSAEILRFLRQV